jgi:alpha-1,2-mannosyltransferase
MTSSEPRNLLAAILPVAAIASLVIFVGATLAVAGDTLGFDYLAYHVAARRIFDGQPLYDMGFEAIKGWGLFYYPPLFLPLILPFGLLDPTVATWLWTAIILVAFFIGVAILPVSRTIRWVIVLLAALSWPFVYAIKLGQVGPLLFLTFAIGWRWLDDPARLGLSAAVGTAIKMQPALILAWALLTRRWTAVVIGIVALVVLAVVATLIAGLASWGDFLTLMRQVVEPIRTERNMTPGAVLFRLGVDPDVAGLVQIVSTVVVLAVVVVAASRATAEASYLVAVTASQLLSPVLWDHYAMLLLLPVAYLLAAGQRWAVLIPLATSTLLINVTPPIVYPICFFVTLVATMIVGWRPAPSIRAAEPSFA